MKIKVLVCAGTRPEIIKLAPLIKELKRWPELFSVRLCATGQHREMFSQACLDFDIIPDISLEIMTPNQTLSSLCSLLFKKLDAIFLAEKPDLILIQGDTTTVMVATICAFFQNIPVGHVEAGLRSFDLRAPFPEEMNRRVASIAAEFHFCPTESARQNLLREGFNDSNVYVTGNTVIDALLMTIEKIRKIRLPLPPAISNVLGIDRKMVLITGHRRENFGEGFRNIFEAIVRLSEKHPDVIFVYPVHLNPNVQESARQSLCNRPGVVLIDPLPYTDFVHMMDRSYLILSDSGGVQEEAPSLGKPVLVMRDVTERPDGVQAGTSILVGTNTEKIIYEVDRLLMDEQYYINIAKIQNPFGDGKASQSIVDILKRNFFQR